jgi:hypothetical protein
MKNNKKCRLYLHFLRKFPLVIHTLSTVGNDSGRCRDRTCDLSDVNGTLYH